MSRRMFTKEFKVLAAQRILRGESGSELARELEVRRTKLYEWAAELERYGDEAFPGAGRRAGNQPRVERGREDEARLAALERKIGQQTVEIDFLQQACVKKRGQRPILATPDFHGNPKTPVSRLQNIYKPSEINTLTTIPTPKNLQKLDTHL